VGRARYRPGGKNDVEFALDGLLYAAGRYWSGDRGSVGRRGTTTFAFVALGPWGFSGLIRHWSKRRCKAHNFLIQILRPPELILRTGEITATVLMGCALNLCFTYRCNGRNGSIR
jgi:hypothetical protein